MTSWLDRLESRADQLVEEHSGEARDFSRYKDDPVGFLRDVLKADPWQKQEEIANAVRDHPLVAVQSANACGKDFVAAGLALWATYAAGFDRIILMSATERQAVEILMLTELHTHFHRAGLPGRLGQSTLRLPGSNKARVIAMVSRDASNLSGFHGERVMVILSEAQGIEAAGWNAALRCAVGQEDRILAYGNPDEPSGTFYDVCRRPDWKRFRISAFDLPTVKGERHIPGMMTAAGIERFRREYGEGSREWMSSVLGLFPETATDSWIDAAAWDACVALSAGPFRANANGLPLTLAFDVARATGGDSSALAVIRGPIVESIETWEGFDLMASANRIDQRCRELGLRKIGDPPPFADPLSWGQTDGRILIDTTGAALGMGILDRLNEKGWPVEQFDFAGKPPFEEGARFANMRAWSYMKVKAFIRDRQIALLDDPLLREEAVGTRYTISGQGAVQIEPKKKLRSRLGRSPDRLDAVVMGLAIGAESATIGGTPEDVYLGF